MIPTTLGGSNAHYGECGFVRTFGVHNAVTNYGETWYRIVRWGDAASGTEYDTEEAARAASDIGAEPPTTYRNVAGDWRVWEVDEYWGPFPSRDRARRAKYHPGTDLAGLTEETACYALAGGRVVAAGNEGAGGRSVRIETCRDGVFFVHSYQHLHELGDGISTGRIVQAGRRVGTMGRTGNIDNDGASPSNYPTHCHFYTKRRAIEPSDRLQNAWHQRPGRTGYFRHKPGSWRGPRYDLRDVEIDDRNIACLPENSESFHLLPCAGEASPGLAYSADNAYRTCRANRCANLPDALREAGTESEQQYVRTHCWARTANRCPWEPSISPATLSRYYRWEFDGQELRVLGTERTDAAGIASAAVDATVLARWRAYSGRPKRGRRTGSKTIVAGGGNLLGVPIYGKRFDLSARAQAKVDEGPVPEGEWVLDVSEAIDLDELSWIRRQLAYTPGTWGNQALRIAPLEGTDTLGREGHYLHGGSAYGDAGGIDLRDADKDAFRYPRRRPGWMRALPTDHPLHGDHGRRRRRGVLSRRRPRPAQ